jgi:DNA invertase Pin-like site-specific DNA recombinase
MAKRKGYGRVSSKGQEQNGNSLADQERQLKEAGCDEIILETYTGTKMDRPKFGKLVEGLEEGDTLVVCKLDRFARTASEGSELVKSLLARGVNVHILNMGLIENTPTGRLILNVLLSFAEFERDMIVERTSEGKALAKATNPDFKEGRPRREVPAEFFELLKSDVSVADACKRLGIHRTQWYRWKNEVSCRA